jgi:phage gpG-like protein
MATQQITTQLRAGFEIRLDSRALDAHLQQMHRRLGTLRPFLEMVWPVLHRSAMLTFQAGGRPVKWKPLSLMTIAQRKKRGTWQQGGQPILQEYGVLRQSIGSVFRMTATTLEYGTTDWRAPIHQYGAIVARGKRTARIPARPFLLFQVEDVTRITAMASAYAWGTR